ncbi:pitrilysin family protein [Paraflavitalea sp. CAU 1676]|uniref:M16 family metallopeptidase n=1 Tax=Paraflavitalea sp. CAU 1676 TaxID=3032598 RepID=UPI0023DA8E5B|nr:pitrilysin family protein [Paraflavitalea sp. CAU 1676]MDF2190925.1 pitrilysin family protein [Paraflavitalea sp. CAU 1676]
MLNRTIAPTIKEPVDFTIALPAYKKYTLSNGIEVYTVDMGSEDTLMVNWVFYAGNWNEEKKAVAAATNFLLKNGTSKRTAFDINEHFEYHGAYLNRACYSETSEITLHCLNRHTDQLLPVVAELLTDAVFPEEEMAIYKQNAKQRLKVNLLKSEFVAGRLIDAYLFGEHHPYGKYNNAEDYDAIVQDDVKAFYKEYYQQGRCVIFAAGRLPGNLIEELEKHFGTLPLQSHRAQARIIKHIVEPASQLKNHVVNDAQGVQAAIRIARPFPNRHHPDFQKTLVLNSLFGGFFGSRLMANIREDKGYTYGIYSFLLNHIHDSGWMISTEAGRDVSEATITEVYNEMELLREEPVDEEELLMTRNYMIGSILGDLDGPFQVIGRWKSLILNNLDENYFHTSLDVIRKVSAQELQELSNKYLHPGQFYELVVI